METEKLLPTHMVRFHEHMLQRKREHKNDKGEYVNISKYSVYKCMVKLRAYISRLESERMLGDLKPIDVPVGDVPRPLPKYLTKEELKQILTHLDKSITDAERTGGKDDVYNAYLYRAIIRFLYTSGHRNEELRKLKPDNLNLTQHIGEVLGKGNKYAPITFSQKTREYLEAYLAVRRNTFPGRKYTYIFTAYNHATDKKFSGQALNRLVKLIGNKAGVEKKTNVHLYRHTLATHLVQDNHSLVDVREKMRHSSISITNQYLHSNPLDQMAITKNMDLIY